MRRQLKAPILKEVKAILIEDTDNELWITLTVSKATIDKFLLESGVQPKGMFNVVIVEQP
jgi:hypothetical protein